MDGKPFDVWTKGMAAGAASRRTVVRALAGGALAAALARLGGPGAAAGRCRKNGKECRRDNQCCSGRCARGKCRRAPHQGTCTVEKDSCGPTGVVFCNGQQNCHCWITSRGTSFCGRGGVGFRCRRDADCAAVTGPGSACVRGGSCSGRICRAPCPGPGSASAAG